MPFGSFVDTESHLGGLFAKKHPKSAANSQFQAKLAKH